MATERSDVAQALLLAAPRLFGALGEVRTSLRPANGVFDRAARHYGTGLASAEVLSLESSPLFPTQGRYA